jgi:hypothetical protein
MLPELLLLKYDICARGTLVFCMQEFVHGVLFTLFLRLLLLESLLLYSCDIHNFTCTPLPFSDLDILFVLHRFPPVLVLFSDFTTFLRLQPFF